MIKTSTILTALALAVVGFFVTVPAANATHAGSPTSQQLLGKCGSADYCQFKPSGAIAVFNESYKLAGSSTNCTNFNQTRVIRYESTTGATDSWGIEIAAKAELKKIFEVSVKVSYSHTWSWSDTTANEIRQDVGAYAKVNIYLAKQKSKVSGTWEIHFGSTYYGHYYWYVNGSVTGQVAGQPWDVKSVQATANC
ncbi:hypothetical protein ACIRG5_10460 [Lentzea sp. NPDC102401]|uniref:hypothetical protein n=1 Tax=Lentzea sp. NPDC102401 TaxID=3364128 RepID=UPI0037F52D63